ncbi:MAG: TonB-dependent receptor [Prevotella sp.]|nr:TonB-dependent receptor [Prevotella sp.]
MYFLILLSAWNLSSAMAQVHQHVEQEDSICEEDELHVKLNEVVVSGVTGQSLLRESPLPFMVVSQKELTTLSSTNIVDAIAKMPGVAQLTTGSGISKPVIRGLGYNRVAVVSDGIRQEGQQWGDEHGVEIDAADVNSVEILKGPASLMYGSDALAGVVVFRPQPTLPQGTMRANVQTEYQTNNGLFDFSLNFAGNQKGTIWDLRYSEKLAHAYKNKYDGYVPGSQFHERGISALVGQNFRWGHSHLKFSYYHLTPSIVTGERDETTGELGHDESKSLKTYSKTEPYQQIRHYKLVWNNSFYLGDGRLNAILGYQQNRRQEFGHSHGLHHDHEAEEHENEEEHEHEADEAALDFRLHTLNYDLRYISPELSQWKLSTGINGMWQRSQNLGEEALIPAYRLFDFGIFATATRTWERWNVSGGVRYDRRWLHANAREGQFNDFRRNLDGVSGSLGVTYCISDNAHFRLNFSRGFRAPNLSELASNGVHEGSLRFERGNQSLRSESSWQVDCGIDYSSHFITAQLSLFASHIDNFIFLSRLAPANVAPAPIFAEETRSGGGHQPGEGGGVIGDDEDDDDHGHDDHDQFPVFQYTAGTARLWGGEAVIVVHPFRRLHIENTFSYVATRLLHQPEGRRYLPTTPQPRWTLSVKCDLLRECRHVSNSYASVGLECYLKQDRVFTDNETETPTPSYTLLNASAGTDVLHRGKRLFSVYLTATNLLNRAYQNHLSRLKYADLNPVTGRRGVYNMGRNITVKVVVPINF